MGIRSGAADGPGPITGKFLCREQLPRKEFHTRSGRRTRYWIQEPNRVKRSTSGVLLFVFLLLERIILKEGTTPQTSHLVSLDLKIFSRWH